MQEGFCHCGRKDNCTVARIDGFIQVKKHSFKALRFALATHGPIASSINADRKTMRFYSHGIYDDPKCGECHFTWIQEVPLFRARACDSDRDMATGVTHVLLPSFEVKRLDDSLIV